MSTYFSLRNTLLLYTYGEIELTAQDRFVFALRRALCLPEEGIPAYVGLISNPPIQVSNDVLLKPEQLDANALKIWNQLRTILEAADAVGRLQFLFNEEVLNPSPEDSNVDGFFMKMDGVPIFCRDESSFLREPLNNLMFKTISENPKRFKANRNYKQLDD